VEKVGGRGGAPGTGFFKTFLDFLVFSSGGSLIFFDFLGFRKPDAGDQAPVGIYSAHLRK